MAAKVERREFVLLAHPAKLDENIGGWLLSVKLDGMRSLWDGGISRDVDCSEVPYANPNSHGSKATGLWSRYGNPIYAPDWFLNTLPCIPLDGELWKGRGKFQETMSTVRKHVPVDAEWQGVEYKIFSTPSYKQLFKSGLVKNPNAEIQIDQKTCLAFLEKYKHDDTTVIHDNATFYEELVFLDRGYLVGSPLCSVHIQIKLPEDNEKAWAIVDQKCKEWVKVGDEGGMLRSPTSVWNPKREHYIIKVKPCLDAECTVIGATTGKGKYAGMIGNLLVKLDNGTEFELSGFTDEERALTVGWRPWAKLYPGAKISNGSEFSERFPLGTRITFKYRELSVGGVPKEGRYLRIRPEE